MQYATVQSFRKMSWLYSTAIVCGRKALVLSYMHLLRRTTAATAVPRHRRARSCCRWTTVLYHCVPLVVHLAGVTIRSSYTVLRTLEVCSSHLYHTAVPGSSVPIGYPNRRAKFNDIIYVPFLYTKCKLKAYERLC